MKKGIRSIFSFALLPMLCGLMVFSLSASGTKGLSWYIHKSPDNSNPQVMPEAANFFGKYSAIFAGDASKKTIYLTFDAGYDNGNMTHILDALKSAGVKAAFFLDGNFVKRNPELVKRIAAEGHLVCNHTLNHPDMTKYGNIKDYSVQLTGWEDLVKQLGITPAKFERPPSGIFNEQTLSFDKQLGYVTVFWSAAYGDWDVNKQMAPDTAIKKIEGRITNGSIVLLHSVSATNAKILPQLISDLKSKGYSFGSLYDFAPKSAQ